MTAPNKQANATEAAVLRLLNINQDGKEQIPGPDVQSAMYAGLVAARAAGHAYPGNEAAVQNAVTAAIGAAAGEKASHWHKGTREAVESLLAKPGHYQDLVKAAGDPSPKVYSTHR